VILELEVEGSFAIRRRRPDACLIFIEAPIDELERRLVDRNTEMEGEIRMRLRIAREQAAERDRFDHVVINVDAGKATDELLATMRSELAGPGGHSRLDPDA
jgi:guanylate kinase